jgi:hypothetical protein
MYYVIRRIADEPYSIIAGPFETTTQADHRAVKEQTRLMQSSVAGAYVTLLYIATTAK